MKKRWIVSFLIIFTLVYSGLSPAFPNARPANAAITSLHSDFFSGNRPGSGFQLSYIQVNRTSALNNLSQVTLEAWVKRVDASRNETVVCNDHSSSYCLGFMGGHVFFTTHGTSSQVLSNATVGAGAWVHIAGVYANGISRIYINGIQDVSILNFLGIGAASGGSLGIGADLTTDYNQNYFQGWIDNVRLWNTARNGSDIKATMFTELGNSAGLLAEWRLNGDANDSSGNQNNGTAVGPLYEPDGALPHSLAIPQVGSAPTLDGSCDARTEYNGAVQVTASSTLPPGTSVYLERTASDLWVCFDNLTAPTWAGDNWAAVYLDPNYSRDPLAQPDDFSLEMHHDGSRRTRIGNASGDYTITTAYDSQWDGKYTSYFDGFTWHYYAEFRISNSLIGATSLTSTIGLALAQHWISGIGDDRFWPALAAYNSPLTWSAALLLGNGPARTFSGNVDYLASATSPLTGIPGVTVQLIGSQPNVSEAIVATAQTLTDGSFSLTSNDGYPNHRLEIDPNTFPKGYQPYAASAYSPGHAFGDTVIDYGTAGGGTYGSNLFTITDVRPGLIDQSNAPFFLIVAPAAIINKGSLNDFVDYKHRVGFQVEVESIEFAIAHYPGANTLQHIRNMEINRYNTYGSRFRYVLLVGSNATLPFGRIDAGAVTASDCLINPGWPTDWFYADLTSNWDTNGNGCWGDGIFGDPSVQASNHYTPDSKNVYHLSVYVGRLPFDDPYEVLSALYHSMEFERSALDLKRQALLSMSMTDMHGECYNSDSQQYESCNAGTDGAFLGEAMRNTILAPNQMQTNRLYENQPVNVGGVPTGASGVNTALQDTYNNLQSTLQSTNYGLVSLYDHGNNGGVYRTLWGGDLNGNGLIDDPTAPFPPGNQSVSEINNPLMFDINSPAYRAGLSPVYLIAACSTGLFTDTNSLGASLVALGKGIAWVGGTATLPYAGGWQLPGQGGMQDTNYTIASYMIGGNLRLGEAVWLTMAQYMYWSLQHGNWGWWAQDYDLYGDPTLSYWGDPGGQATLSPWPMLRQDAYGHGATTLMGPSAPSTAWTYSALARVLDPLPPSPVIAWNGDVVVAHGNFVDVVRNGNQQTRLTLEAPAYGSPAIAADGTIYALDRGGILYAFGCGSGGLCNYSQHWTLDLTSLPLTSPVIGPDGLVAVAHEGADASSSLIALVRSDGKLFRDEQIPGQAVGELAVGGDGVVYATTTSGTLVKYDFKCPLFQCLKTDGVTNGPAYTTPPLLYENSIFAGKADGSLVRKNGATLANIYTFQSNGVVTSGPIVGPGGAIVFGTDAGTLYDMSSGLSERWHVNLGAALVSMPASSASDVYIASGNFLRAYDPFSGKQDWAASLGNGANGGSIAVGYGRQVLVQTRNGPVVDITQNWVPPSPYLHAQPRLRIDPASGFSTRTMTLDWLAPIPVATAGLAPTSTPLGYQVQRRADGGAWQDLVFLPYGTLTYDDDTVQDGTRYDYRIQVLDSQGNDSDYTILQSPVQSLPTPPSPVLLNPITPASSTSLKLNWSVPVGDTSTSFRLERGPTPSGPFTAVITTTASTTSYTDIGLSPNTTYDYRVISVNDSGESSPSNVQAGTTFQQTLPAPQNVKATLLDPYTVRISWDPGPGGVTTVIEMNALGEAGFKEVGSTNNAGPFTITLTDPNSYAFRLKFVQGDNESPYSTTTLRLNTAGFSVTPHSAYLPVIRR